MAEKSSKKRNKLNKTTDVFLKAQIMLLTLYVLSVLIMSVLIYNMKKEPDMYFYYMIVPYALSNMATAFYSGYKMRKNGLITGLLCCLPINIIITLISLFTNGFNVDFTAVISVFILLICAMLGGVLSVNTKTKIKPKR